jgi:hypothetical protein
MLATHIQNSADVLCSDLAVGKREACARGGTGISDHKQGRW